MEQTIRTRIILIRHGQTEANVRDYLQGSLDTPLTPLGIAQAKLLGERLKLEPLDVIISSDLGRAVTTTQHISRHHSHLQPLYMKEVRERCWGIYEGRPRCELHHARSEFELANPGQSFPLKQGEAEQAFYDRIKWVHDHVLHVYRGKTTLIIAHGAFNGGFIRYSLRLPPQYPMPQDSCAFNACTFEGDRLVESELVLNCSVHLECLTQ